MRLQVFLSHSRVCSRRKALVLVMQGQVRVNGIIIQEPSYDVNADLDKVYLRNKEITLPQKSYLMLHKPCGFVTTLQDKYASHTVMDLLPEAYKDLYPVGRLDKDSEGLLLFTNDGDFAFRLLHPRFKVDKEYFVEIEGCLAKEDSARLEKGVIIDDRRTHQAKVALAYAHTKRSALHITIHEGRKRQIRRMLESVGYKVIRLKRVQYGPLRLGNLAPGKWRLLEQSEVESLVEGG